MNPRPQAPGAEPPYTEPVSGGPGAAGEERCWTIIECPDCGTIRTDEEPRHRPMCVLNGQPFERYGNWIEVVEASRSGPQDAGLTREQIGERLLRFQDEFVREYGIGATSDFVVSRIEPFARSLLAASQREDGGEDNG